MEYFRKFTMLVLNEKCFDELFVKFNLFDVDCLKYALSKTLGMGIIVGSTLVKLPQILKIMKAQSGEGISFLAVLLELLGITSTAAYSYAKRFPFSSWGESIFLVIETAIIGYLVLHYSGRSRQANLFASLYCLLAYLLMGGMTPLNILWSLQAANLPVVVTGKMIQVIKNFRNGHTGQLSATTIFLLFLGSCTRIFTSVQETGDQLIIVTFMIASLINGILAFQVLYYWNVTAKLLSEKKKQE